MSKVAKLAHKFARHPDDWYVEPGRCTEQLLTVERFVGPVLDPTCGQGNIVKALLAGGVMAVGSDLVRRVSGEALWFVGELDFINGPPVAADNIVFNPPYFRAKGTEACIRRALAVARGKVCVFVDRRFVTGGRRARGLYADHPPTRIWEISPRPSCPTGDFLLAGGEAKGGTADFCWLVWDLTAPKGVTVTGWLTGDE